MAVRRIDTSKPRAEAMAFRRLQALESSSRERRFENMLDRHERRLTRAAYGILGDANRVEDVLQEALVKAYRHLPAAFESERHEAAWLYRIVFHSCLNELRARRRRHSRETPGLTDERLFVTEAEALESSSIAAALQELDAKARGAIVLVDVLGFDYETAAAAVGVPRGTLAYRLHAARGQLREALRRHGVTE